jgi:hypothetical protein
MFKMKKLLFVLISSLATISLTAQNKSTGIPKFYIDGGVGMASHNGVFTALGGTAVLKNNWLASISYYNLDMNPKNLPSNYEPGFTMVILFPFPDEMPSVKMSVVNFIGGKLFPLGRKTWITAEAGLSVVAGEKFQFTPQPVVEDEDWHMSSNYSTQKTSQTTVGGMLRTNFNWAFSPYVGLSVGGFANLNSIQSPVGVEFKLIAGWLNTKKKSAK